MLKAVIFDLDGLLVDSTPLQLEANRRFLSLYDKPVLSGRGREGMRIIDIIEDFKDIYNLPGDIEELYKKRQEIFLEIVKSDLKLFDGVTQLLEKIKSRNLKIAMGTSGDTDYIKSFFNKFPDLPKYFSVVVTGDEVMRGKPYPDIYLEVIKKLAIKPQEAVVVEDSVNGIAAAKSAGIQVICVPNQNYPNADYSNADKIFLTLKDVDKAIM
jgi:HAD superfamily hydrolase (TIGR01509 family)